MTFWKWSKTAATNATADSTINWAEGQAPSTVNDSARAMMAAASKYRDDESGSLLTTGTSTAYVLATNQVFDTLAHLSGAKLKVRFHAASGAAPTLAVDSLTAAPIQSASGTAIPTGSIQANSIWDVTYDNSIPAFIVSGSGSVASNIIVSATQRLLGRSSSGAGPAEELSIGSGLLLSGGALSGAVAASVTMINGTIVESNGSNAVTFALKTLAGADPSATDPVYFAFRNATVGTGNFVVRTITAALSLVISSGSTMGFANAVPGKLWIVAFDTGSSAVLGAINTVSGTTIYPLAGWGIASSTAEGGAGAADSAQVFYTAATQTSKPYIPLAYAAYETGLTTAGSWNVSPTRIQLFDSTVRLPGTTFNPQFATNSTIKTVSSSTYAVTNLTINITPTSATNLVKAVASGTIGVGSGSTTAAAQLQRGSTAIGNVVSFLSTAAVTNVNNMVPAALFAVDAPGTSSSTAYAVYLKSTDNTNNVSWNVVGSSSIIVEEIMT